MSRRGPDIRLSVMLGTTITSVKIPISHVLVILSLIELSPRATCLLVTVRTLVASWVLLTTCADAPVSTIVS
jgi:hypothetical protein